MDFHHIACDAFIHTPTRSQARVHGIKAIEPHDDNGDDEKGFYFHSFPTVSFASFLARSLARALWLERTYVFRSWYDNFATCVILHIFLLDRVVPSVITVIAAVTGTAVVFSWYCDCCLFWFCVKTWIKYIDIERD